MGLHEEIERIANNDLKDRHSYFQLQFFLIGKEPTNQAKLWRCIRELKTRKESIDSLKLEIDDVNDDIALINIEIQENTPKQEDGEKSAILFRKIKRKKDGQIARLNSLKSRLESIEEECAFIVDAFNSLSRHEALKPYDDINAQKQYWNEKLGQEFNLRLLLGMPPDLELMKTILALNSDAEVKKDALQIIDQIQQRLDQQRNNKELDQILEKTKQNSVAAASPLNKEKNGV